MKMRHFVKHWPNELASVRASAETIVCLVILPQSIFCSSCLCSSRHATESYRKLQHASSVPRTTTAPRASGSKFHDLLHELDSSDDENSDNESGPSAGAHDPAKPWLREYNLYFNTTDEIPEGQSLVQWWGVGDLISLARLTLIL